MDKINLKKILVVLAALGIVTSGSILIAATTNNKISTKYFSEADIVKEINQINFKKTVAINSQVDDLVAAINPEFIQEQLPSAIRSAFKLQQFKLNEITVNGKTLTDSDLTKQNTLNAKINYNYGAITSETAMLTIKIFVDETVIVDAINEGNYQITVSINTWTQNVKNLINGKLITSQLKGEVKDAFNPSLFFFKAILIDGYELQESDLTSEKTIPGKINYDYGSIVKRQTTNLTIKVVINDEGIINTISRASYQIETSVGSSAESVVAKIDANFIKAKLSEQVAAKFNDNFFQLLKIIVNEEELQDQDLTKTGELKATINYSYNDDEQIEFTNLIIKIE